ncbi:MAG: BrnT family toxin [Patescibacteria group bacterium]
MQDLELPKPLAFEWDSGNQNKSYIKHGILSPEAEQAFVNDNLIWGDEKHSYEESRYNLLGITDADQILFISFTIRKDKIRIISARLADKKERKLYEKEI